MNQASIKLGGQDYPVGPIPLGRLKRLMPALSAFSRSVARLGFQDLSEADMANGIDALAAGLDKPVAEVEAMPATFVEIVEAVNVLAIVAGLVAKAGDPGETAPGSTPATDLTLSTG
jgi:hypothetical protein